MTPSDIGLFITTAFSDVIPVAAWGETSYFYNPGRLLPRGVYFATVKEKDGANDCASHLGRPGVFRLNFGLSKDTYRLLLGPQPQRPPAGEAVNTGHDFAALNQLLPHPVYAWMSWACILNPSAATFGSIKPLLAEAYGLALTRHANKTRQTQSRT